LPSSDAAACRKVREGTPNQTLQPTAEVIAVLRRADERTPAQQGLKHDDVPPVEGEGHGGVPFLHGARRCRGVQVPRPPARPKESAARSSARPCAAARRGRGRGTGPGSGEGTGAAGRPSAKCWPLRGRRAQLKGRCPTAYRVGCLLKRLVRPGPPA